MVRWRSSCARSMLLERAPFAIDEVREPLPKHALCKPLGVRSASCWIESRGLRLEPQNRIDDRIFRLRFEEHAGRCRIVESANALQHTTASVGDHWYPTRLCLDGNDAEVL